MLNVYWSPKGGSGTSVVAAAVGLLAARAGRSTLLVDLAGDLAPILGQGDGPGASEWMAAPDAPIDALASLEVEVAEGLRLLPWGGADGPPIPERRSMLVDLCGLRADEVIVDAGTCAGPARWWGRSVATVAVVRSCYLGLRLLGRADRVGDRVVLVEEPGRALSRRDVESALGTSVLRVPWDPAVARAVDAGLLASRLPRGLRPLEALASGAAR